MKFLIVRFSSIGDIVLTSPVIRQLKALDVNHEIHFVCKSKFLHAVEHNPHLSQVFTFEKEITEISAILKAQHYDFIIDLHNNLRSRRLSMMLGVKTFRFEKLNVQKWLRVNTKLDMLPKVHIVERYLNTLSQWKVAYDGQGLDFFTGLTALEEQKIETMLPPQFHAFVIGGAHFTKQIPVELFLQLAQKSTYPIVLLGGKSDEAKAQQLMQSKVQNLINLCGTLSLAESAFVISKSQKVVTADTGLMHIAAAFHKNIIMIWGNTIPEFGMYPLLPLGKEKRVQNYEVQDLKCRPCSKIGFMQCPKKHFDCMMKQDMEAIVQNLNSL